MKIGGWDLAVLRGVLLLLVLSLGISSACLAASYYFWDRMEKEHQQNSRKLASVRNQYQTVDEEERIIEEYLPRYEVLARAGVIGIEERLNWIESLRGAARDLELPAVRYSLGSQVEHAPLFPIPNGKFQLYASEMSLEMGLLHEEDLFRFLGELDRRAGGLFSVSECTIVRGQDAFLETPDAQNLQAQCALLWYTLRLPESARNRT